MKTLSLAALTSLALSSSLFLLPSPAWAWPAAKPYDFDGDGKPDLVVGAPRLNRGSIPAAGGIVIMAGSGRRPKIITQSTKKVAGGSEPYDGFGSALASADFDRDGYADLAVGIPYESFKGKDFAGAVTILYGSAKGLTGRRSRQISEPSGKQAGAVFGAALAAGDLNGDGYPDLAVGAPGDGPDLRYEGSGSVTILLGGRHGIRTSGSRVLRRVRGSDGNQDYLFGSSLAVGDVDGTGSADVVVLSRGRYFDDDGEGYSGYAAYCSGAKGGPSTCRRLATSDIANNGAVVIGNVQGDLRPEIIIGVPTAAMAYDSGYVDVGHIEVLALAGTGAATTSSPTSLHHGDLGLPGSGGADLEGTDDFGSSLALGRINGDSYDDLVIGAPSGKAEDVRAGQVHVVHGGAAGLAKTGNATYDQDIAGLPGHSEDGDGFGSAVTLLDRNGDGKADLTIGAPAEDNQTGRVTTLLAKRGGFTTKGARTFGLRNLAPHYNRAGAQFGAVLGE